jgi:hypothetical protein
MSDEHDDKLDRFDQEYRRWGRRPAATPPGTASTRIRALIRSGRTASPRWNLAWAAALVLAVVGSWLLGGRTGHAPSPSPPAVHEAVALPDNVVLWWLDPETPVYFVIRPAEPEKGGR